MTTDSTSSTAKPRAPGSFGPSQSPNGQPAPEIRVEFSPCPTMTKGFYRASGPTKRGAHPPAVGRPLERLRKTSRPILSARASFSAHLFLLAQWTYHP